MVFTNPASANDERTFEGTLAEWNALSLVQKTFYTKAIINNDYTDNPVGNLNALTTTDKSSCVGAINEVNVKANTYGVYTISDATSLSDFFFKLTIAADNDLSNKPDYVLFNIIGLYENVDLFYGVIDRTDVHNYLFTFTRSFGSKMYCGNVDITNSYMNLYEYSGTLVS